MPTLSAERFSNMRRDCENRNIDLSISLHIYSYDIFGSVLKEMCDCAKFAMLIQRSLHFSMSNYLLQDRRMPKMYIELHTYMSEGFILLFSNPFTARNQFAVHAVKSGDYAKWNRRAFWKFDFAAYAIFLNLLRFRRTFREPNFKCLEIFPIASEWTFVEVNVWKSIVLHTHEVDNWRSCLYIFESHWRLSALEKINYFLIWSVCGCIMVVIKKTGRVKEYRIILTIIKRNIEDLLFWYKIWKKEDNFWKISKIILFWEHLLFYTIVR